MTMSWLAASALRCMRPLVSAGPGRPTAVEQLPLGPILPVAADKAGPLSGRITHSATSCSTGSARHPILMQPP